MMDGNFGSIMQLVPETYSEEITITGNGKSFTCKIDTAVKTSTMAKYQNGLQQRELAVKHRKQIDVTVPLEIIAGHEDLFDGWKDAGDGKATFPVVKQEEILTATTIETFVGEPQLTWAEAVVFARVNGSIALKIQKRILKWLQDEGLIESKND